MKVKLRVQLFGSHHYFGDNQKEWENPSVKITLEKEVDLPLGEVSVVDGFEIASKQFSTTSNETIFCLPDNYEMFSHSSFRGTFTHKAEPYTRVVQPYLQKGFQFLSAVIDHTEVTKARFDQIVTGKISHTSSCSLQRSWLNKQWYGKCNSCLY